MRETSNAAIRLDDWREPMRDARDVDPAAQAVQEMNEKHFLVTIGGKACIAWKRFDPVLNRKQLDFLSRQALFDYYANDLVEVVDGPNGRTKRVSRAKVWFAHPNRNTHETVVFLPGAKEVGANYNLWQGWPVEPVAGNCSLYWGHVRNIICGGNQDHYRYVRTWMAHALQRPRELPGVALVLRGGQGTGKNTFVSWFGRLFGQHFLEVTQMGQVAGRFNAHLRDVLLLHANEAVWGGDKASEGTLKALITDDHVAIEAKGRDIQTYRNFKRLIVSSNEDWAAPVGHDDRRFLPLDVRSDHKEDKQYFAAIQREMEEGGLQALMHNLLNEDLVGFQVRTAPPSRHAFDLKLRSAPSQVQWWFEVLQDGCDVTNDRDYPGEWNPEPAERHLFDYYQRWCAGNRVSHPEKKHSFTKTLRAMLEGCACGVIEGKERKRPVACQTPGWGQAPSRERVYDLPSLEECRAAFERYMKAGPWIWGKGGDPHDTEPPLPAADEGLAGSGALPF